MLNVFIIYYILHLQNAYIYGNFTTRKKRMVCITVADVL